jgi:hypothetical protein
MISQIAKKKRIFGSKLGMYGNLPGAVHQKGFFLKADLSTGIDGLGMFFSSFHVADLILLWGKTALIYAKIQSRSGIDGELSV